MQVTAISTTQYNPSFGIYKRTVNLNQSEAIVTEQFKREYLEQYNKDFNGENTTNNNI